MITAAQLRAARGLLGWTQENLAEKAIIALSTVRRMEAREGPVRGLAENVWRVQRALEDAGVIFIDADIGIAGPGVRLKKSR